LSGRLYDLNKHGLAHCLSAIGARAGITPWPKDCLRHSYASHLYAATENAHLVARRMGHMTSDMLHSNYNNRRTREQGEAYFQIRPSGAKLEAKIVAIAA
jgi:integrase